MRSLVRERVRLEAISYNLPKLIGLLCIRLGALFGIVREAAAVDAREVVVNTTVSLEDCTGFPAKGG